MCIPNLNVIFFLRLSPSLNPSFSAIQRGRYVQHVAIAKQLTCMWPRLLLAFVTYHKLWKMWEKPGRTLGTKLAYSWTLCIYTVKIHSCTALLFTLICVMTGWVVCWPHACWGPLSVSDPRRPTSGREETSYEGNRVVTWQLSKNIIALFPDLPTVCLQYAKSASDQKLEGKKACKQGSMLPRCLCMLMMWHLLP